MTTLAKPTPHITPNWKWLCQHPAYWIGFGFGSGLSPKAPGTVGSLLALPLYAVLSVWLSAPMIALLCIPAFFVGVWACEVTGKALGVSDYGGMVWDEIVAMWLVLSIVLGYSNPSMSILSGAGAIHALAAFGLFRLFDITKPWPIGYLDRKIKGGLGVMVDDVVAAGFAIVSLLVLRILVISLWPF